MRAPSRRVALRCASFDDLVSLRSVAELPIGKATLLFVHHLSWHEALVAAVLTAAWWLRQRRAVYLIEFTTFAPPDTWKCSHDELIQIMRNSGKVEKSFDEDDLAFMGKILANSGTGAATAWPPGIIRCKQPGVKQDQSVQGAREEAEVVICRRAPRAAPARAAPRRAG